MDIFYLIATLFCGFVAVMGLRAFSMHFMEKRRGTIRSITPLTQAQWDARRQGALENE